jgi:hypothetical protein
MNRACAHQQLFGSTGKSEQIAELIVDSQQIAASAGVMTLGEALRGAEEHPPHPCRQRLTALPDSFAELRRIPFENVLDDFVLD